MTVQLDLDFTQVKKLVDRLPQKKRKRSHATSMTRPFSKKCDRFNASSKTLQ